jgi:trigger factor
VRGELATLTTEFARQAKIPGFRPGKVPAKVVRTKFEKEIRDEALDRLLPRFFFEAVKEKGLEPVGNPSVKSVDPLTEEAPVRFVAAFEIKPQIDLQDYRGLAINQPSTEVDENELGAVLDRLREQASSFEPVTDRVAQEGDYLVIDIDSSGEDVEPRKSEDYQFQLGENAPLAELNEQLFGRSPGDKVSFEKTYDENAPNELVRGKTVKYDIVVKEVRTRMRPELNDDFARSTGIGESLDEMKNTIREDLRNHKERDAQQAKRKQIGDHLTRLHQIEAPDALVEEELGNAMRDYARYLASQGIDLEKAQVDWEKVRDEFKPEAENRVKRSLILEAIAKKEGLQISDVEVDAEIRKAAQGANREFTEVKHRLRHDGGYESLRTSLLQEKALELLLNEARVS